MKSLYDLELNAADGTPDFLKKYKGKVTMVVNTTVGCGNANQMEVLEWLQQKYKDRGFEIVALPTNDYCGPGVTKGAWSQGLVEGMDSQNYGCDVYGTTFGFSEKVNSIPNKDVVGDLNGIDEPFGEPSEIFNVIADQCSVLWGKAIELGIHYPFNEYYSWWLCQGFYSGQTQAANFEKYLVDKDGFIVKHYSPSVLNLDVEKTLKENLIKELELNYGDAGADLSRIDRKAPITVGEGGKVELAADHILMVSHRQQQAPGPGHGRSYKLFEEEWSVVCSHIEELLNGEVSMISPRK
jgi:glutathione peroxidase